MKYRSILLLFLNIAAISSFAQTTRTDVVVVGNTAGGLAAAIQSSRSGVKTILISSSSQLNPFLTVQDIDYLNKIQNYFSKKSNSKSVLKDSLISKNISISESAKLIKSITDTVKNLTVLLNSDFRKIEKKGKGWEIKLMNGKTIKTDVLVDASPDFKVAALLKINPDQTILSLKANSDENHVLRNVYRSSIGYAESTTGSDKDSNYLIPLASLLPSGVENFLIVPKGKSDFSLIAMSVGQAAGASAAFCAFYKTTTKNLNVRIIQGELLGYDSRMVPFIDIDFKDRHGMAFQRIALSGLLKLNTSKSGTAEKFMYDTLGTVSAAEIRLAMKQFYSRSQIWFADNKKDTLKIEDVIKMMMFSVARGEELRREIETGWKESFQFNTKFDPKRAINRREFTVLADRYLQPFNIRVDLSGNLLN